MRTPPALIALLALLALGASADTPPAIFIDPGHGGALAGAHEDGLQESGLAFEIASELAAQLKAAGFESQLSRDASSNPSADERVSAANASGAKSFLSLHFNHSPSPSVRGPRIFIPKPLPPVAQGEPRRWERAAGQRSEEARGMAQEIARALGRSETAKVSVQNLNLVIFKGLAIPGVVVELGFLSHAESRAHFGDAQYRRELAGRLAEGILAWARPTSGTAEAKP